MCLESDSCEVSVISKLVLSSVMRLTVRMESGVWKCEWIYLGSFMCSIYITGMSTRDMFTGTGGLDASIMFELNNPQVLAS